jgi:hypothetical protein
MSPTARVLASTLAVLGSLAAVAPASALDRSVEARLEARGTGYEVDEDGDYQILVRFAREDRTQLVFVSGRTQSIPGFSVREVFSPAARLKRDGLDGAKALELMRDSRSKKLGSWEIAGDVLYYVIKLPDSIDAVELDAAILIAAELADDAEIRFSGDDDAL